MIEGLSNEGQSRPGVVCVSKTDIVLGPAPVEAPASLVHP